ncbi:MAG TPA: hypothetical protein VFO34_05935 [Candidatus Acidoferrales bacterium]|nr:hypothetical protein [Candidatus Acidoferrales bacterium]
MQKTEKLNFRVSQRFKRRLFEEAKKERRTATNYMEAALSERWGGKSLNSRTRSKKGD